MNTKSHTKKSNACKNHVGIVTKSSRVSRLRELIQIKLNAWKAGASVVDALKFVHHIQVKALRACPMPVETALKFDNENQIYALLEGISADYALKFLLPVQVKALKWGMSAQTALEFTNEDEYREYLATAAEEMAYAAHEVSLREWRYEMGYDD